MSKMLWEVQLPVTVALAKENIGVWDIFKYTRPYRMFMARFKLFSKEEELTNQFNTTMFFTGKVAIAQDSLYGVVVGRVNEDTIKVDPNGNPTYIDIECSNGFKKKNLKVGKDVVIVYHDSTRIPPILYLWNLAQKIIEKESIIDQQDNMLRKPIIVTGEGEEFDNAMNNAQNVLSGLYFLNTKSKKDKKRGTILSDKEMEVLNLQLGNSYKGAELWDSRKHYEELICDYLGYTTTKNEKRERMNSLEVENENSIGMTFYEETLRCLRKGIEQANKLFGVDLRLELMLKKEEVKENDNQKEMARKDNNKQSN